MRATIKLSSSSLIVLFALFGCSTASWGSVIYEVGLPAASNANETVNGSNPEPADRVNVNWNDGPDNPGPGYDIVGDSFSFASGALVNSITVYEVANTSCGAVSTCSTAAAAPGTEFSAINLYLGPASGPLTEISSANLVGGTYSSTPAFYGADNYQGNPSGNYYQMFALTFTFTAPIAIGAGVNEAFAVDGVPNPASNNGTNSLFLAAVNGPLDVAAGAPVTAFDNQFLYYLIADQASTSTTGAPFVCDSGSASCGPIWDKSSDLNVQIQGTVALPEPGSIALTFLGIAGFAYRLRRRSK